MFNIFGKKITPDDMFRAAQAIQMGIFFRLAKRYMMCYDSEFSDKLAAAVVNELFYLPTLEGDAKEFAEQNKELIDKKISDLRQDEEIKYAFTQAFRVMHICGYGDRPSKDRAEKIMTYLKKAAERGVFIDGGEAPKPEMFISFAKNYSASSPE